MNNIYNLFIICFGNIIILLFLNLYLFDLFIRVIGYDSEWIKKFREAVKVSEVTESVVPEVIFEGRSTTVMYVSTVVESSSTYMSESELDMKAKWSLEFEWCRWEKMVFLYLLICLAIVVLGLFLKRYIKLDIFLFIRPFEPNKIYL